MKKAILVSILSFFFFNISIAQSHQNRCPKKNKQMLRIKKGSKSGALTKLETKDLLRQQKRIKKSKMHFKSDGKFTIKEKRKVKKIKKRASKNIHRKKHNTTTKRR